MKSKVLFVCMGNICRSPTAEGVFRHYVKLVGLAHMIEVDSAGTHAGHVGAPPDARSIAAAARRRYDLRGHKARQVQDTDFVEFDHILAMDRNNLSHLQQKCPPAYRTKLRLFMDHAPSPDFREVPDPYYGGSEGFELVLDLVEEGAEGLLDQLRMELGA